MATRDPGADFSLSRPEDEDLELSELERNESSLNRRVCRPDSSRPAENQTNGSSGPSTGEKPSQPSSDDRLDLLYNLSHLAFFAMLGTLARLGLSALTTYPSAPITTPVLWPNLAGSLIIGFLATDLRLFHSNPAAPRSRRRHHGLPAAEPAPPSPLLYPQYTDKKTVPLYVGLATGFCGSLTSFSTFQRDVFLALADASPAPAMPGALRSPGQSFLALLASLILTPAVCLAGAQAGGHLAWGLDPYLPTIPAPFTRQVCDRAIVLFAALAWLGAAVLAGWPPDRPGGPAAAADAAWNAGNWRGEVLFALVFAPLGCWLRWSLALLLNRRAPRFPLGTFAANVGGTLLESMLWDLQHAGLPAGAGGGHVGCQVLQGTMDGFCGCLTTVSTWVAEMRGLGRRWGYVYGVGSMAAGLASTLVVMGGLKWTQGFAQTACGS